MSTITLEEAQTRLPQLIDQLAPGEEVLITRDQQTVARLIGEVPSKAKARRPGTLKGTVLYMADDFNAPLDDLKEYME